MIINIIIISNVEKNWNNAVRDKPIVKIAVDGRAWSYANTYCEQYAFGTVRNSREKKG
jgi:hypothetical protein